MIDVFWHDAALGHDTGAGHFELPMSDLLEVPELHPENSERIRNMRAMLRSGPLAAQVRWREGRLATEDELTTVPISRNPAMETFCRPFGSNALASCPQLPTISPGRNWRSTGATMSRIARPYARSPLPAGSSTFTLNPCPAPMPYSSGEPVCGCRSPHSPVRMCSEIVSTSARS